MQVCEVGGVGTGDLEPSLLASRVFRGMENDLEAFARLPSRELEPEAALLEPGEPARAAYVLLSGRLRVHVGTLDDQPIGFVEAGEIVGELALLDGSERSAWVVADGPCRLLEIDAATFWSLIHRSRHFASNLLELLSIRLKGNNSRIKESRRLQLLYERRANLDALTGLHNRRWLEDVFPRQVRRSELESEPLSVLMIDVDHFKRINDTFGHAAGDFVLFAVAKVLESRLRPTDLVARYGGEEFAAILPKCDLAGAGIAAERVRREIAGLELATPSGVLLPHITASIGGAQQRLGIDAKALLSAADGALYRAKGSGRNRVELAL